MCIICLKPAGKKLPSDEDIEYMFEHNPDGAGFAIQGKFKEADGKTYWEVRWQKGFMTAKELLAALKRCGDLTNYTVAIHCRIKTHGKTDPFTTHPFKISNQYQELRKLQGKITNRDRSEVRDVNEKERITITNRRTKTGILFHNGTFPGFGGLSDPNASDTQDFVIGVAYRYLRDARIPNKVAAKVVSQLMSASRVLILYPDERVPCIRFGTWVEHEGCWYSNSGYKHEIVRSYNCGASSSQWVKDKLDAWGRTDYDFAHPGITYEWIQYESIAKMNEAVEEAKTIETDAEGNTIMTYTITGTDEWIADYDTLEIYKKSLVETVIQRRLCEAFLIEIGAEPDDDVLYFQDEDNLVEWLSLCDKVGEYTVEFNKKEWYIDTVNLEAYTSEGLKAYFGTGQSGHVRQLLEKEGTIAGSKYAYGEFGILDEEDEEYQEYLEGLRAKRLEEEIR